MGGWGGAGGPGRGGVPPYLSKVITFMHLFIYLLIYIYIPFIVAKKGCLIVTVNRNVEKTQKYMI